MENIYNVFLDDLRPISAVPFPRSLDGHWKIARNYNSFCEVIEKIYKETGGLPQFISFDHDLDDAHYDENMHDPALYNKPCETFTEKTGLDCAKWLVEFCIDKNLKLCNYQVHSMNPVGRQNIQNLLENFKKYQLCN